MPGSIEWLSPELVIIVGPLLLAITLWLYRLGTGLSIVSSSATLKHPLATLIASTPTPKWKHRLETALVVWALFWAIASLAQPIRIGERLPDLPPERDIILLVDVSLTMTLEDYEWEGTAVSRMEMLKAILPTFIDQLKGERLGVIVFADDADTWVPLTRDHQLVKRQFLRLLPGLNGRQSAIGDAVIKALQEAQKQPDRQQILVLITDADSATGEVSPEAAATLASEAGIPLYALAIGSALDSPDNSQSKTAGLIYEPVNLTLLKHMTRATGGDVWQIDKAETLQSLLKELALKQQNQADIKPRFTQIPLYWYCLITGLIPIVIWQSSMLISRVGR